MYLRCLGIPLTQHQKRFGIMDCACESVRSLCVKRWSYIWQVGENLPLGGHMPDEYKISLLGVGILHFTVTGTQMQKNRTVSTCFLGTLWCRPGRRPYGSWSRIDIYMLLRLQMVNCILSNATPTNVVWIWDEGTHALHNTTLSRWLFYPHYLSHYIRTD